MDLAELLPFLQNQPAQTQTDPAAAVDSGFAGQFEVNDQDPFPQEQPVRPNGLAEMLPFLKLDQASAQSQTQPQTPAPNLSVGQSTSVAYRGFSGAKNAQVVKGTGNRLDKRMAAVDAEIEQRYKPLIEDLGAAERAGQTAQAAVGQAEADKFLATVGSVGDPEKGIAPSGMLGLQKLQQDQATKLEGVVADGAAANAAAKAAYQAKLAAIPQMNPSQLWEEAGTAGRFSIGVAAFVHDFLGAKGIKTSAMDTLREGIDRNIKGQVANIERGKAVASGFKELWEMTTMESNSKQEALLKMQGFALASYKTGIEAEMGKFDSKLALTKSQAASAKIQQEIVKNQIEVAKHIDAATNAAKGQLITINGQELNVSIENMKISEMRKAREESAAARSRADNAKKGAVIFDISKSGGGRAIGRIKEEFSDDKELQRDVVRKVVNTKTMVDSLDQLNELQSQIDAQPDGLVKTRLINEGARLVEAVRGRIVMGLVLDQSGKAATDKEANRIAALIAPNTWFTNGDTRRQIAELARAKNEETNSLLQQTMDDLQPNDPAFETYAAKNRLGGPEQLRNELIATGQEKAVEGPMEMAKQLINAPDSGSQVEGGTEIKGSDGLKRNVKETLKTTIDASALEDRFESYLQKFPEGNPNQPTEIGARSPRGESFTKAAEKKPTKSFAGFDTMRRYAEQGDEEALNQLNLWANMGQSLVAPDGTDPNEKPAQQKHMMALWALSEIKSAKTKKDK